MTNYRYSPIDLFRLLFTCLSQRTISNVNPKTFKNDHYKIAVQGLSLMNQEEIMYACFCCSLFTPNQHQTVKNIIFTIKSDKLLSSIMKQCSKYVAKLLLISAVCIIFCQYYSIKQLIEDEFQNVVTICHKILNH